MRIQAVAAVLLAGFLGSATAATPEHIAGLIERLRSADYRDRQSAFRELDGLGEAALARLRLTAANGDSETRSRAAELVRRIEQRQASARILTPTLVELNFDNKPVREAVTEASSKIGLPLAIVGSSNKINDRRVTFHSGKVSVWEALDGFLRAAELTEWDGVTSVAGLPQPQAAQNDGTQQVFFAGNGGIMVRGSGRRGKQAQLGTQIMVYDGAPPPAPVSSAGAVRIRALPVGTPIPNAFALSDELLIPLQVSTESRIEWLFTAPSIKTADAVDERGQKLTASVVGVVPQNAEDPEVVFLNNVMFNQMYQGNFGSRSQFVNLRLRKGSQPTKVLKEINGRLTLPVRVGDELIAIDQPLQEVGKVARTDYGEITVHSVEAVKDGVFKFEVSLQLTSDAQVASTAEMNQVMLQANMRINGAFFPRTIGQGPPAADNTTEFFGMSLLDSKGSLFLVSPSGSPAVTYTNDSYRIRTTLMFRPGKETTEPARLVVKGTHPTSVDVAFVLRDVPVQ